MSNDLFRPVHLPSLILEEANCYYTLKNDVVGMQISCLQAWFLVRNLT